MDLREVVVPDAMPLERLEAEITELAGHLAAGECRWLQLIAEYDRRGGWEQWGCRSAVQWLSWHCGLAGRAARERLRVAHALPELPHITDAFAAGRLSYSKVRALTRVATPANESDLVMLAEHATASQVDRIVAAYRRVRTAEEETEEANRQVAEQYLRVDWADDGTLVIHGRVPSEIGAVLLQALDAAREALCADARGEGGPAGPIHRAVAATNVDALRVVVESFLTHGAGCRSGGDRYHVVVNVDADVLVDDAPDGVCEVEGGPTLAAETARRLACDASSVVMVRGRDGAVIGASKKTRDITRRVRRMLRARDHGCRFPGCGERRFVDAHHIRHRAHGGNHELENLVELCWFHHRLVHEGGWKMRFDDAGNVVVSNPAGNVIPSARRLAGTVERLIEGGGERRRGAAPGWQGDRLDLDHITTGLWCIDHRTEPVGSLVE